MTLGNIRTFKTKNFKVVIDAEEEYDLDLSFDDTGEVAEKLDSGEFIAFCAHAYVLGPDGEELADDYLGNCIYESIEAFMDHKECGVQNREYERKEAFDEYLNEIYGSVEIAGMTWDASIAFERVDPTAYVLALTDYEDSLSDDEIGDE